jgi:MFS family permease
MHSQLVDSVAIMRKRGRIAFLIVFSELLFSLITVLFYYLQNHWISLGWSELGIGLVFAANAMVAGAVAFRAPAIERRIGERGVLTWVPLFMLLCLWGIALSTWEQLFFILLGCVEGLLATAICTYLNRLIPSAQRATILSFQSMVFSLFMIALFPVAGAMGDRWSLKWSFAGMAALAGVLCVCYLVIAKPFASSDR